MSSSEPGVTASILLLGLPLSILCGIDLLSFTTTPKFQGLKDIPPGYHFVFTSESSSFSLRDGFWLHVPELSASNVATLIVRRWDHASNTLRPVSDPESYRPQLKDLWERNLSPYRQSANQDGTATVEKVDWADLTDHVTPALLQNLCHSEDDWRISSGSSRPQDKDDIPGLIPEETGLEELELGGLGIDLKRTWREGAVGRERTEGAVDRSWALGDLDHRWRKLDSDGAWGDALLGQMQICFLMVVTVVTYSCLEEWIRCLALTLTSKDAVFEHVAWYVAFLGLLTRQLKRCEDVEGGLFAMSDEGGGLLKKWLRAFKRTVDQFEDKHIKTKLQDAMETLEGELKRQFDWELSDDFVRKGQVQLEDGEFVEMKFDGMDAEDEEGEYAPVIVNLNEEEAS